MTAPNCLRNWTEQQGNFSIAGGVLRGNDPAPSIATLNGISRANVTVQADVNANAGGGVGLIARYQANGSYLLGMLATDATGANFTPYLFAYVAGAGFIQLAVGPTVAGPGTLRFVVTGNSLRLFFGPDAAHLALVASVLDGTLTAPGLTGIRGSNGATFDNFTIG